MRVLLPSVIAHTPMAAVSAPFHFLGNLWLIEYSGLGPESTVFLYTLPLVHSLMPLPFSTSVCQWMSQFLFLFFLLGCLILYCLTLRKKIPAGKASHVFPQVSLVSVSSLTGQLLDVPVFIPNVIHYSELPENSLSHLNFLCISKNNLSLL